MSDLRALTSPSRGIQLIRHCRCTAYTSATTDLIYLSGTRESEERRQMTSADADDNLALRASRIDVGESLIQLVERKNAVEDRTDRAILDQRGNLG